jgi:hypothetical protein
MGMGQIGPELVDNRVKPRRVIDLLTSLWGGGGGGGKVGLGVKEVWQLVSLCLI